MGSENMTKSFAIAFSVIALSAVLSFLGVGLHPIWWLTWFALVPLLWFAARASAWMSFAVAAIAWIAGSLGWWHYLYRVIEIPLIACVMALGAPAMLLGLAVLFWRGFVLRGNIWVAVFSLPVAWVSVGYVQQLMSPHSTFGNLAYSQMDFLPLIQIASLAGIWGITFFLLLLPSAAAVLLSRGLQAKSVAATVLVSFAIVLGFGFWRLHTPTEMTGTIHTQLMTNDTKGEVYSERDSRALELLQKYTANPKSGSADLILIPEKIARFSATASDEARNLLHNDAKSKDAFVLAGLDEQHGGNRRNAALLFAPDGSLLVDYDKHHFVPNLEVGYVTGSNYSVIQQPSGVWGVAICKDMDFPAMGRQYGKRGVGVMLVPAWDFTEDDWYHARMAILRGVESGFSIARAAKRGLLTVSDNRGRILLEKTGSFDGIVSANALVPVEHASTLYARWGDWFPVLCIPLFLYFLMECFRKTSSRADETSPR
jgi:apolipoprotein N-acyltransferase